MNSGRMQRLLLNPPLSATAQASCQASKDYKLHPRAAVQALVGRVAAPNYRVAETDSTGGFSATRMVITINYSEPITY